MAFVDFIRTLDAGYARLRNRAGAFVAGREWDGGKSVIEVEGWVRAFCRERGKIVPGSHRAGKNIWTNTGREFAAQKISIDPNAPTSTLRTDAAAYLGVGIGTQLEEPGVLQLVTPVIFNEDLFLAGLTAVEFPLFPARTTVEYQRTFGDTEITTSGSPVSVSELGLFTNGDPDQNNAFGTRSLLFTDSSNAAPIAYKTFEPITKTASMELVVAWQVRF
jgi:hypothetical protein